MGLANGLCIAPGLLVAVYHSDSFGSSSCLDPAAKYENCCNIARQTVV